jgi:opacity protein-like surface antigen
MKKLTLAAVAVLMVGTVVHAAEVVSSNGKEELYITGNYYDPSDNDIYDSGLGMEIQGRYWFSDLLGAAITGGFAIWDIDDKTDLSPSKFNVTDPLDDSVNLYTFGASALLRPINGEKIKLTLEGGLRFIYIDSNVDMVGIDENGTVVSTTVDPDSVFAGVVAADLEYVLSDVVSILGGVGYQFTLSSGDIDAFGYTVGDSEVDSLIVRAGAAIRF